MDQEPCSFCKTEAQTGSTNTNSMILVVECPICRTYKISISCQAERKSSDYMLSAWIRDRNEAKIKIPILTTDELDTIKKSIRPYSVSEKQLLLLQAIERKTDTPGDIIELVHSTDYPLAWAKKKEELSYHLSYLGERDLVKVTTNGDASKVTILPEGYNLLEESRDNPLLSNQCFVAMDFSDKMEPIWEQAIEPAIGDAGYEPMKVNIDPHNENIVFKIIKEIRRSRFMVADLTHHKNGVYFEAGYALGMGIPVIWTVKEEDAKKSHFDVSQMNQIRWNNPEDLKEKLYDFICAIIGEKPKRSKTP